MLPLAQVTAPSSLTGAPQGLPPLPEGPSIERIRIPAETAQGLEVWQIMIGIFLALGLILLFVWLYRHTRKPRHVPIDPLAAASAELEAAEACARDDNMVAALAAGAVRRLLTERYQRTGAGLTADEFVCKLPLRKAAKNELGEFLKECDQIKFAGRAIGAEHREHILASARALVHKHGIKGVEER